MELIKKNERNLNTASCIKTYKRIGQTVTEIGEFRKWKELSDGGRMTVKMTVYYMEGECGNGYFLSDTLGRNATEVMDTTKEEVIEWLTAHGYKAEKDFFHDEYGMDEETWNEWNK